MSAHKFYIEKVGIGILYFLTLDGFLEIGCFIDLFTLSQQVKFYNLSIDLKEQVMRNKYQSNLQNNNA